MFYFDLLIIILSCIQPLVIGFLVLLSFKNYFYNIYFYRFYNSHRSKSITTKLYECSTYSKLTNKFSYNIYTMSCCLLFLIYDVDLIFFFSESTNIINNSYYDCIILLLLIILFIVGLMFDYKLITFNWRF